MSPENNTQMRMLSGHLKLKNVFRNLPHKKATQKNDHVAIFIYNVA